MKKLLLASLLASPLAAFATPFSFTTGSPDSFPHGYAYTWGLSGTSYDNLRSELRTQNKVITSATLTINNIWDWTGETTDPADALFINILTGLSTGLKSDQFDFNPNAPSSSFSLAKNPFVPGNSFYNELRDNDSNKLKFTDAATNSLLKYTGDWTKTGTPDSVTWSDPSGGSSVSGVNGWTKALGFDLVIDFTADNLTLLNDLIKADSASGTPTVGLGFGAECHYYLGDIVLTMTTSNTPPPPPPPGVPDGGNVLLMLGAALSAAVGLRRFVKRA
jgi:hypothetical protein